MDRNEIILHSVDLAAGPGLELGPLTSPIIKKSQSKIFYADHASTADLKVKYADEPVVAEDIVEVDYVLGSGAIADAVGGKRFKYVVAAHVIEHVPDIIRWFEDIATVLEPDGVLSLVIPNKLYTFDIARADTKVADVLDAYLEKRKKFSTRSMYDFAVNYLADIDPAEVWASPRPFDYSGKPHRYTQQQALEMCQRNLEPGEYVDCHCHVFTPTSFFALLRELAELELLPFAADYFFDTNENNLEFYVTLRKVEPGPKSKAAILESLPVSEPSVTVANLQDQLTSLRAELSSLLNSKAWRITGPVRKAAHRARQFHRSK